MKDIDLLCQNSLAARESDLVITTEYGKIMSQRSMKFQTMVNFIKLQRSPSMRLILETLSSAEEFSSTRLTGDKGSLNAVNKHPEIRFKLKGKVSSASDKVFLMIQSVLGSVPFEEKKSLQLTNELNGIMREATRVIRSKIGIFILAVVEIFVEKRDYVALIFSINILQSL